MMIALAEPERDDEDDTVMIAMAGPEQERHDRHEDDEDDTVMIAMAEPELDGDATILIATADLPAGTEDLQHPASGDHEQR